jgi:hypothetical protein
MTYRVESHKWWTGDRSRLVGDGDPDAAILAFPAGTELAESEAVRLGLLTVPAAKIRATPPSNKMGRAPATKAAAAPTNEEI